MRCQDDQNAIGTRIRRGRVKLKNVDTTGPCYDRSRGVSMAGMGHGVPLIHGRLDVI
jgi:hypothetical protein